MRLKKYINERWEPVNEWVIKAADEIYKNVSKKMLKEMDKNNRLLRRNLSVSFNSSTLQYKKKNTHKNRIPRDTKITYHEWVDEWFEKKFNWKARSENVLFCYTTDMNRPFNFNIVFPKNIEKVIWSKKIDDLTYDLKGEKIKGAIGDYEKSYDLDRTHRKLTKEKIWNFLEKSKYKEGSLGKFLKEVKKAYTEVMIKCNEYYIVSFENMKRKDGVDFFKRMKMYKIANTIRRAPR